MRLRLFDVAKDHTGSVLVETAFVLPVLLLLLIGVVQFGMFFFQFSAATDAAAAGARQFSLGRLDTTAYADTVQAIQDSSSNLFPNEITITLCVGTSSSPSNPTACGCTDASSPSCQSLLQTAYLAGPGSANVTPAAASVTVQYQCTPLMPTNWINVTGICPLTSTMNVSVQ
jgi:Flp pilus assembly protein TadG